MEMTWNILKEPPAEKVEALANQLFPRQKHGPLVAKLLIQRGLEDPETAKSFLFPDWSQAHDPFLMKDMDRAVDRMAKAVLKKEKIFLYGDYDVDGTTSVSLISHCLEDWGVPHEYHIPDREREGYGLSYEGIQKAINGGYQLMVVMDCGTKEAEKVRFGKINGVEMIICDHHTPGQEPPGAFAFLNPRREDCSYPFKDLSACGVAFKLIDAVNKRLIETHGEISHPKDFDVFQRYGDLVALSIACDIVPVLGENRLLAKKGIEKLKRNPIPGLKNLMAQSANPREWNIGDLVFFLGPRVNSAGRLGSANRAVDVLRGRELNLEEVAEKLNLTNEERKEKDKQMTLEALEMYKSESLEKELFSTVLFNENWHKGVVGIVASRMIEHHYQPTVLMTKSNGKWVGSGRSIEGFDLYGALLECSEHIDQFGGHMYAAGLTIREENLILFKNKFNEVSAKRIRPEMRKPRLNIDLFLEFNELDFNLPDAINALEPFGPGNPEPVFMSKGLRVLETRIMKEDHIRLLLEKQGRREKAVGFGLAKKWNQSGSPTVDIAWRPSVQEWNNRRELQVMLKDFRPSEA